jgi:hypothetical protein
VLLTYAYADLNRAGLRRFLLAPVSLGEDPYLCWSVIYFSQSANVFTLA